jgi:hypothetical protein
MFSTGSYDAIYIQYLLMVKRAPPFGSCIRQQMIPAILEAEFGSALPN